MNRTELIEFIASFILIFRNLVVYAIVARVIISWFSMGRGRPTGKIGSLVYEATDPFIGLARRIPHRIGMLDLSPLIALLGVDLLGQFIANLIFKLV